MCAISRVCCTPGKENLIAIKSEPGAYRRGLETHVVLKYLWSVFFKWHVIDVTLVTLKIEI